MFIIFRAQNKLKLLFLSWWHESPPIPGLYVCAPHMTEGLSSCDQMKDLRGEIIADHPGLCDHWAVGKEEARESEKKM